MLCFFVASWPKGWILSRSRPFKAGLSGCHIAALPAAYGPAWRPAAPAMAAVDIDFEDFGLDWQPLAPKMCIACGCYALPEKRLCRDHNNVRNALFLDARCHMKEGDSTYYEFLCSIDKYTYIEILTEFSDKNAGVRDTTNKRVRFDFDRLKRKRCVFDFEGPMN